MSDEELMAIIREGQAKEAEDPKLNCARTDLVGPEASKIDENRQ
jgi:hypothetical protein